MTTGHAKASAETDAAESNKRERDLKRRSQAEELVPTFTGLQTEPNAEAEL